MGPLSLEFLLNMASSWNLINRERARSWMKFHTPWMIRSTGYNDYPCFLWEMGRQCQWYKRDYNLICRLPITILLDYQVYDYRFSVYFLSFPPYQRTWSLLSTTMPIQVEHKLPIRPSLTPRLRASGHQPEELVNMLVLHSRNRGSHLDSDQRNALRLFSKIPNHHHPKEEFITKFFFIFDELFFFKSLRKYCYIEYSDHDWRNKQYSGFSKMTGKGQIIIRMLAYEEAGLGSRILSQDRAPWVVSWYIELKLIS